VASSPVAVSATEFTNADRSSSELQRFFFLVFCCHQEVSEHAFSYVNLHPGNGHLLYFIAEALRYGTHCKGSQSVICTPSRLSANGMNHAFAFPAEDGPHFTDPGEWKAEST